MTANVIGGDVRDNHVIVHLHIHKQRGAVMGEAESRAAIGCIFHLAFSDVRRRDFNRTAVRPAVVAAIHRGWCFKSGDRGERNGMGFGDRLHIHTACFGGGNQFDIHLRRGRRREAKLKRLRCARCNLVLQHRWLKQP